MSPKYIIVNGYSMLENLKAKFDLGFVIVLCFSWFFLQIISMI